MPRFSIITPVNLWNTDRVGKFLQTIKSIEDQTFRDFEWIVVDDGSNMEFNWRDLIIGNTKLPDMFLVQKKHEERVIACNAGFKAATGEWWLFLDSDDELAPEALKKLDEVIKANSKFKMFNWGARYVHTDGKESLRGAFEPKRKKVGHEVFGGGNIVNGTFAWHRLVYEDLGGYPGGSEGVVKDVDCTEINYPPFKDAPKPYIRDLYMNTPYDFSAAAQLELPEIRQFFMVDHEAEPQKILKELGNPWGQDYYLFYKYTRRYHSKPLEEHLLIVHPKQ